MNIYIYILNEDIHCRARKRKASSKHQPFLHKPGSSVPETRGDPSSDLFEALLFFTVRGETAGPPPGQFANRADENNREAVVLSLKQKEEGGKKAQTFIR